MKLALFSSALLLGVVVSLPPAVAAQDRPVVLYDMLDIDATVTSEVAPDLAVVTLAIVREGPEVSALTKDVNEALARAFAEAKAVPGVIAANGGYSTFPRYDSRGASNTRTGWQVRAEIILKSKDFNALGSLVGRLSQNLQISGSGFEISPDLRAQESASLLDRGARAFQDKAAAAAKAFGYAGYTLRQVTVGSPNQSGGGRPVMMRMEAADVSSKALAPLPVESGRVTLSLTVNGSLQMRK